MVFEKEKKYLSSEGSDGSVTQRIASSRPESLPIFSSETPRSPRPITECREITVAYRLLPASIDVVIRFTLCNTV